MSSVIPVIVRCPKVGCPRSLSYCHTCDDMKGHVAGAINRERINTRTKDKKWKKLKEMKKLEKKNKEEMKEMNK